jgi:RNA polymerase sigma-70 factor (ECF subfamily)
VDRQAPFEGAVTPHLNAAYNLARWLTRNDDDAEDVVQETCLRAYRSFDGFRGRDARSWILAIVRNSAYSWLAKNRAHEAPVALENELLEIPSETPGPERVVLTRIDAENLRQAIDALPPDLREVIVLREMEDLSYKEIAELASVPIGTVMSRLARARERLRKVLSSPVESNTNRAASAPAH